MGEDLSTDRLKAAIARGFEARAAYWATIDDEMAAEQSLGAPATEADILRLEQSVGRSLPPSYRMFLALHDGWKMPGGVDLLSVGDMLGDPWRADLREWQRQCDALGEAVAARGLVIGASRGLATKCLLDPHSVDGAGEWAFVEFNRGEAEVHPSFLAWLDASSVDFESLLAADPDDHGGDTD